jgi:hypothetical protein
MVRWRYGAVEKGGPQPPGTAASLRHAIRWSYHPRWTLHCRTVHFAECWWDGSGPFLAPSWPHLPGRSVRRSAPGLLHAWASRSSVATVWGQHAPPRPSARMTAPERPCGHRRTPHGPRGGCCGAAPDAGEDLAPRDLFPGLPTRTVQPGADVFGGGQHRRHCSHVQPVVVADHLGPPPAGARERLADERAGRPGRAVLLGQDVHHRAVLVDGAKRGVPALPAEVEDLIDVSRGTQRATMFAHVHRHERAEMLDLAAPPLPAPHNVTNSCLGQPAPRWSRCHPRQRSQAGS